jgi:hypothetical protein
MKGVFMKTIMIAANFAWLLMLLVLPLAAEAQTCSFQGGLADGRVQGPYTITSGGDDLSFAIGVVAGRSYAIEALNASGFGSLSGNVNTSLCPNSDMAGIRDISGIAPHCPGCGLLRWSFTAASTGFVELRVHTTNATGMDVLLSASETTIYSPAWSTNGVFDTFYSLQNTTNATINATITLLSLGGSVVDTATAAIPTGGTFSTNTSASGLATPRNQTGVTRITHDGPSGSILCEAVIASFAISPPFSQVVKCAAVR